MEILLLGLNHRTASVELRERLAIPDPVEGLNALKELPSIQEGLVLSTCNRVEMLVTTEDVERAIEEIISEWSRKSGVEQDNFKGHLYVYRNIDAVTHIFRVASSLDSLVIGEPQILGQLKDAFRKASDARLSGPIINRLLHKAFSVAKRVRTETGIASKAVSISYAAVELAKKIFGDLKGKKALLIGAGEMAELAAEHLLTHGIEEIIVANRTFKTAFLLAERFNGRAIGLGELRLGLLEADIVISSTGSTEPIIDKKMIKRLMRNRKNRPLFFIDIAVPRDIDPKVHTIDNVYLYDIDDLEVVVQKNLEKRQEEASKAERIIEEETIKFEQWLKTLSIVPIIVSLRERLKKIGEKELKRTIKNLKGISPEDEHFLEIMVDSLINKILHHPITYLKKSSQHGSNIETLEVINRLFNLDGRMDD